MYQNAYFLANDPTGTLIRIVGGCPVAVHSEPSLLSREVAEEVAAIAFSKYARRFSVRRFSPAARLRSLRLVR